MAIVVSLILLRRGGVAELPPDRGAIQGGYCFGAMPGKKRRWMPDEDTVLSVRASRFANSCFTVLKFIY